MNLTRQLRLPEHFAHAEVCKALNQISSSLQACNVIAAALVIVSVGIAGAPDGVPQVTWGQITVENHGVPPADLQQASFWLHCCSDALFMPFATY